MLLHCQEWEVCAGHHQRDLLVVQGVTLHGHGVDEGVLQNAVERTLISAHDVILPGHGVNEGELLHLSLKGVWPLPQAGHVVAETDGHGHRQELHQHGTAHDDFGGYHHQHGSTILEGKFEKSEKDLNYLNYYHMYNVVSEGMIGSGVLESLPEVCPPTTNADMQYDVDKDQT